MSFQRIAATHFQPHRRKRRGRRLCAEPGSADTTAATKSVNSKLLDELPFSDKSDFDSPRPRLTSLFPK